MSRLAMAGWLQSRHRFYCIAKMDPDGSSSLFVLCQRTLALENNCLTGLAANGCNAVHNEQPRCLQTKYLNT